MVSKASGNVDVEKANQKKSLKVFKAIRYDDIKGLIILKQLPNIDKTESYMRLSTDGSQIGFNLTDDNKSSIITNRLGLPISRPLSSNVPYTLTERDRTFLINCDSNENGVREYVIIEILQSSWKQPFTTDPHYVHKKISDENQIEDLSEKEEYLKALDKNLTEARQNKNVVLLYKYFIGGKLNKRCLVESNRKQTLIWISNFIRYLAINYDEENRQVTVEYKREKSTPIITLSVMVMPWTLDQIFKDTIYSVLTFDTLEPIAKIDYSLDPIIIESSASLKNTTIIIKTNRNNKIANNKVSSPIHVLLLTGNIGAGKTSVLNAIRQNEDKLTKGISGRKFSFHYFIEVYANNQYLMELYGENQPLKIETSSLGFKCQFQFLLNYYKETIEKIEQIIEQSTDASDSDEELVLIFDRSMWDSLYIFSQAMLQNDALDRSELELLKTSANTFDETMKLLLGRSLFPDRIIILDASTKVLLERIARRADENPLDQIRQLEKAKIDKNYLSQLSYLYQQFHDLFKGISTRIDTGDKTTLTMSHLVTDIINKHLKAKDYKTIYTSYEL